MERRPIYSKEKSLGMLANPMKYVICYMGVKQVNGFFYVNYGIKSKAVFSRFTIYHQGQ